MGNNQDDEIEIDLKELFYVVREKLWMILLTGLVGAICFGLYTAMVMKPVFTSSTMLYVVNKSTTLPSLSDLQLGTQLTKDYKVLITSRPVTTKVIENLDLNTTHEKLIKKIQVTNPQDTRILAISVEDTDPYMAKAIADEVAKVASVRMAEIMDTRPPNIIEEAYLPTQKTKPSISKNTLLGGMLGVLLSGAIVVVLFVMNDAIKTPEDVEKYLGLNTLSAIPVFDEAESRSKKKKSHKFGLGGK